MKYLLCTFIFFLSCNASCSIDLIFNESFNKAIKRLEKLQLQGVSLENPKDSVEISGEILNQLTGHKPLLREDYSLSYLDSDFKNDLKIWRSWYKKNKCALTKKDFDDASQKAIALFKSGEVDYMH